MLHANIKSRYMPNNEREIAETENI